MCDEMKTEKNKSWKEYKQIVRKLRKELSDSCVKAPSCFTFRSLPNERTRIYYLNSAFGGETTLFYCDVSSKAKDFNKKTLLQPQRLFNNSPSNLSNQSQMSKEELLLNDRKRTSSWGISYYESHPDSGRILFNSNGSLYQCSDNGKIPPPFQAKELNSFAFGARLNPCVCPSNQNLVAYVNCGDLWIHHMTTSSDYKLTYSHNGLSKLSDDPVSSGIPSYVIQEEFDRYIGMWWQPSMKDGVYRILYEETDEKQVSIYSFGTLCNDEEYRFPRVGTQNAKSSPKIVEFTLKGAGIVSDIKYFDLVQPLERLFPWFEYLINAGWTPDSDNVWVQLLDRRQKRLDLILIPLEYFSRPYYFTYTPDTPDLSVMTGNLQEYPPITVLVSEESSVWINVHSILRFLPCYEPSSISFIWASEETGWRHLYLVTSTLNKRTFPTSPGGLAPEDVYKPNVFRKDPLTSGDWEVDADNLWLDEVRGLVYFVGFKDTPLETHLYVVSLSRPNEVRRLTQPGHSHSISMDKNCRMFITVYSNNTTMHACQIFGIKTSDNMVAGIQLHSLGFLVEPRVPSPVCQSPVMFSFQSSSGDIINGMVFKPHNIQEGCKYPTVLNIYGGPKAQMVNNTFKGYRHFRLHLLASQGYCVVLMDCRGSSNRGLLFESYISNRMGTVEVADHLEGLEWLAKSTNFIDMSRVAVHGWSYGGYLSLMALALYPQVFKLAIAAASVTSWAYYDTAYTERYMGLPDVNGAAYGAGCVLNYIDLFPDEMNRLFLVHGLLDDNVHFKHSSKLIQALIDAGKPYHLQIFPNERHSLRHFYSNEHFETYLLSVLQGYL